MCIYNVFDRYLKGIELIRNSSCSHPFDECEATRILLKKNNCSLSLFQIYNAFAQQKWQQRDIIVNNYDTSLVSGMYILNKAFYLTTSIGAIYFFYNSVIISPEHLKRSICQGRCVYFTTLVAIIHIITSGLWLIRKKLNDMYI